MKITRDQLKGEPKKIGKTKEGDVFHVATKGGFNIIMLKADGQTKMLGAAPHIGIAKYIAKKNAEDKDLVYFELSKGEDQVEVYKHLVPVFEKVTEQLSKHFNG